MIHIGNDWDGILSGEFRQEYYNNLRQFLDMEYDRYTVYPERSDIFNALKYTPYNKVKAVIIGQDPYPNPGQAHGLCFSVQPGVSKPRSLLNIFKELNEETGTEIPESGYLLPWAEQGVLLLNTILTVRQGAPKSHKNKGWENLTNQIIEILNKKTEPVVFILWGVNARSKKTLITNPRHLILESTHPSPRAAYQGFFGCGHFNKTNEFLKKHGVAQINWKL
jgi:uracil-DNA glycosylase